MKAIVSMFRGDAKSIRKAWLLNPLEALHYRIVRRFKGAGVMGFNAAKEERKRWRRREPPVSAGYLGKGHDQFDYLVSHGLSEKDFLLDFGCGYMRMAEDAISYLKLGRYFAADISAGRIQAGKERLARNGYAAWRYDTVVLKGPDLRELSSFVFDVVWAFSVFQCLPDDEFFRVLKSLRRRLFPGGKIFFDFPASPESLKGKRQFFRPVDDVQALVREAGYGCRIMADWPSSSIMLQLRPWREK